MTERPELHPDPKIDAALPSWKASGTFLEVYAARRLFDTWNDLEAFFADVIPRSTLKADGVYRKGGWRTKVEPGAVLRALEELDVQRDELPQAALLIMNASRLQTGRSGKAMGKARRAELRSFISMFSGVSLADLVQMFYYVNPSRTDSAAWVRECLDQGVSPEYIRGLRHVALRSQEWPPARLGELYRAGAPAAYPALFWDQAAEFWALHKAGVPFEYAKMLRAA